MLDAMVRGLSKCEVTGTFIQVVTLGLKISSSLLSKAEESFSKEIGVSLNLAFCHCST